MVSMRLYFHFSFLGEYNSCGIQHPGSEYSGAAFKFNGRPDDRITGMDMCHLLLLLPFFLFNSNFNLQQDEVDD